MDVLTSETCSALNNEIIKQMTSSWSLFIQIGLKKIFYHADYSQLFKPAVYSQVLDPTNENTRFLIYHN